MKFVRSSLLTRHNGTVRGQTPHLAVRFTSAQRAWLNSLAAAQHLTVASVVRECVERVREQEGEKLLTMLKSRPSAVQANKAQANG